MPDNVSLTGIEFTIKGNSDAASRSISELSKRLDSLTAAINKASGVSKLSSSLKDVGNAARSTAKKTNEFMSSILRIAKYRLIRSAIKAITSAFQEGLKNAYAFSKEQTGLGHQLAESLDNVASASLKMKNQLGAAFGSLLQAIAPTINAAIELITKLAEVISMALGALTGQGGYLKAKDVWTEWGDAASAAGGAAKEALRYLAPFDELNRLPSEKHGGGGGGGTNAGDMFEWVDFEQGSTLGNINDFVAQNLEAIEALADLYMFAIGLVLVASGVNIPLGLGLMAVGGYKLYQDVTQNWDKIKEQLQGSLGGIIAGLGGLELAIGLILAFSGVNIPLGIALIAVGAAQLATAVAVNWNTIKEKLQGPLGKVVTMISGASLLLGILLCVAGMWPLGLGLIVAGAAGLASTVAANWDNLKDVGKKAKEKVKAGWDAAKEKFDMAVQLVKNGWTTVKNWVVEKGQKAGDLVSSAVKLAKRGWQTVKGWIEKDGLGGAVSKGIGLIRNGWTYVSTWIKEKFMGKYNPEKGINIIRNGWTYVSSWIKDKWMGASTPEKGISIIRKGWEYVSSWITGKWMGASTPEKGIGIVRKGWEDISTWIKDKWMGSSTPEKGVGIFRQGWDYVSNWIKNKWMGNTSTDQAVGLWKNGWSSVTDWVANAITGTVSQSTWLYINGSTIADRLSYYGNFLADAYLNIIGQANTPTVDVTARYSDSGRVHTGGSGSFAKGGAFYGGSWHDIPQAAIGGSFHGTLFWAGENGAEVVGNAGGRTEVLNKSQIASAIYSATRSAMSNASMDNGVSEETMYRAFSRALADSNLGGDIELDGDTLYRAMVNRNRANTRLTGVNAMA